ncbi:hypothetical protein A9X02_01355 [Mycobacterium malmoense]|nr:hypothetical protein A9X02_01355 [Mycobacterium malmoense]
MPMPPVPITTTVSPPRTPARRAAEPYPVGTAQASSAAGTSGKSGSIFTSEFAATTVCSAKAPIFDTWPRRRPSMVWWRKVPSVGMPGARVPDPVSHRYSIPEAHHRHWPQTATKEVTTWSPGANPSTPAPTSTTTPEPSWPPIVGDMAGNPNARNVSGGGASFPCRMCSSEWHSPVAASRTKTSPALGGSSSNSSTDHGRPYS